MSDFLAGIGHNSRGEPPPEGLAARGFAKHRKAMADLPVDYREPTSYATLEDWLAANPSPRLWARATALEMMQESAAFRELGMDMDEATYWLEELAEKWKRRAEAQRAKKEGQ